MNGLIVGIDASRNRSGGAKAHILGILGAVNPQGFGISRVHIWSYKSLLEQLPDYPWLVKHSPEALSKPLIQQLFWQRFRLEKSAKELQCDILLNTDAASISSFTPAVTMSRDMLSYEPGQMELYGFSLSRLRLFLLKYVQSYSLSRAEGVIFLTNYAATVIQEYTGNLGEIALIPHGVGEEFRQINLEDCDFAVRPKPLSCVYVSNAAPYKNQLNVIKAVKKLRELGFDMSLKLVGAASGKSAALLSIQAQQLDPDNEFVDIQEFIPQNKLPKILSTTDIFVFASSCENMPNTLIEAMAAKLPIACSNRGPMPEVLGDSGVYFDPLDADSIVQALTQLAEDESLRFEFGKKAGLRAEQYTWDRCAISTWNYLHQVYTRYLDKRNSST